MSIDLASICIRVGSEFPEPSELPSFTPLQLIEADFDVSGWDDFGLQLT